MIVNWRITVLATGFVLKPCYYQSYAYSISDLTSVRSRRQCQKRQRRQRLDGFKTTFETTRINNNRHSASDWLYNMGTLPRSSVLREIRNPVFSVMAWSTFIALFHQFLIQSSSTRLQNMALAMRIGTQLHSLLVSSLGLLLVFRTNSAYQRFTVRFKQLTVKGCNFLGSLSLLFFISSRRGVEYGNKYFPILVILVVY